MPSVSPPRVTPGTWSSSGTRVSVCHSACFVHCAWSFKLYPWSDHTHTTVEFQSPCARSPPSSRPTCASMNETAAK